MTMEWGMDQQAIEAGLGPAFFLSLGIFLLVVLAISRRWIHGTAAALIAWRDVLLVLKGHWLNWEGESHVR